MKTRLAHIIGPLLVLILFVMALGALHHQLSAYHIRDIFNYFHELPSSAAFLAILLTFFSYMTMTGYDTLALRYIRHPLSYARTALASFIGYAFSNNVGFSMIMGASVRYRLYTAWGLTAFEITQVIGFCTLTLWLGFFTMGGLVFLLEPLALPTSLHLPFTSAHIIGVVFLVFVAAFILGSFFIKRPFRIRDWDFSVPSPGLLSAQIAIASMDWIMAGAVLFALLPASSGLSFPTFIGLFLLGQLAGMISQVPGGLGVFESVIILLLMPYLPPTRVLGSLLAYRGIYYIIPFIAATLSLAAHEIYRKKAALQRVAQVFGNWGSILVPHIMAFTTFIGGTILLLSGATPTVSARLSWLKDFMPLPVIEISHFLGSLVGGGLLLLSRGLQRRIDAAYVLTILLLACGIAFSLLKGLDYEEAIVLSIMLVAILPCHRYFYRSSSLLKQRFTPAWILGIIAVLIFSLWLGFFSYKHVEYSGELWWRFTITGNASRFLRASVGVVAAMLFYSLAKLLRPAQPKAAVSHADELERVWTIVQASPRTSANLALLGDKLFLFNQKGSAFIMYGIKGRSWISMGDPVGPEKDHPELVWQFREMVDRYDGWTVFYEVGSEKLPLYIDLGLTLLNLGEEARVPLEGFSLEGSARKGLRYTVRKLEKEGYLFQVVPRQDVPSLLPDLKNISDAWLRQKNTAEKGFSLGFFDEDYLRNFPVAIIRKWDRIVSFANLWTGAGKEELSVDLMRFLPEAPEGAMEYLFIQLILWGKQEGYRWFNMGMAPLAGLEDRGLAPLWSRLGAFVFSHGEHFYNFQGLRRYKDKFDPEWRPKYMACPGGLAVPRIMANIASLVSGSMKGVIAK